MSMIRSTFYGANCDLGESFGIFRTGDDENIAPHIQLANIACGVHGGDPMTMRRTVALALQHGIRIGAHPSLPDHAGFGRREMKIAPEDLRDNLIYQIGALKGFVDASGGALHHLKLHGVIYSMSGRDRTVDFHPEVTRVFHRELTRLKVMFCGLCLGQDMRGLPFRFGYC
jgi:5-oxoprolinase (ATP-hydrolysing) subunit A